LESAIYEGFYYDKLHRLIPYIIDEAARGDYELVRWLIGLRLFERSFSVGMYMAVTCSERGNTDPSKFDRLDLPLRLVKSEKNSAEEFVDVCKRWKIPLLSDVVRAPVSSDVPALLLSGDFDPITPPSYAEITGKTLRNKFSFVFPNGAHGQILSGQCAERIMAAFINDPTRSPDASCLDTTDSSFYSKRDLVRLPILAEAFSGGFWALKVFLEISAVVVPSIVMLLAGIVYGIVHLVRRLLRRKADVMEEPGGWTTLFSRAAPWLGTVVGLLGIVFIVGLILSVVSTYRENEFLLLVGVVKANYRWILIPPWLIAISVLGMAVATAAVWAGEHRSLPGRIVYSILTLIGLICLIGMSHAGFLSIVSQ